VASFLAKRIPAIDISGLVGVELHWIILRARLGQWVEVKRLLNLLTKLKNNTLSSSSELDISRHTGMARRIKFPNPGLSTVLSWAQKPRMHSGKDLVQSGPPF